MVDVGEQKLLQEVDDKGFVPDEVRNNFFRKLRIKNDNRQCFECTARNPTWISLTYGVYLCLECSGEHRRKGVHISFVRSVELDKFAPDQMVQMACGGNGKAWTFFKQHGMGKTSDGGRPVDYNSKTAQRYKQQLEKDCQTECAKLNVAVKQDKASAATAAAKAATANAVPVVDPVDEATDFSPLPQAPKAAAPSNPVVVTKPVVKQAAVPTNVVVRKPSTNSSPTAAAVTASKPTTTGFSSTKQMAKQIEFDFDFDELENEASKPAPVAPAPVAAPTPTPAPATFTKPTPAPEAPQRTRSSPDQGQGKYGKAKAISSDDFFGGLDESASQRMERETRYNKFSGAAAISSSSFFGDGPPQEDDSPMRRSSGSGEGMDDWKASASSAASKGADIAKAGISKGAELLTTYLNKVRD